MNIGIVGLGLIGGSMAKTIRRNTPHTVLGTDTDQVMYKARLLEAIDGDLTTSGWPSATSCSSPPGPARR